MNRFAEKSLLSQRASGCDSRESPQTSDSQMFSPPKRDSQWRGSVREPWNDSRESGDFRESANRFARIGPSKSRTLLRTLLGRGRCCTTPLVCALRNGQSSLHCANGRGEFGSHAAGDPLETSKTNPHKQRCALLKHLSYFRNPCDRDPPTRNFINFKFFKNSLKILNVLLGNERLLLGNERWLLGNERLLLGIIGFGGDFWNLFCCWGGFGRGSGAPYGFSKILHMHFRDLSCGTAKRVHLGSGKVFDRGQKSNTNFFCSNFGILCFWQMARFK